VFQVLKSFPKLKIGLSLQGNNDSDVQPIPICNETIDVMSNQEYVLVINMQRINKLKERKAYTPRYHKSKSEGWFLTLGDIESGELIAMKRVTGPHNKTSVRLTFYTPPKFGMISYCITLFYRLIM
jgi:activating signal cointegrator complex subunit 3